ncbi:hypothetical protein H5410_004197 [Solanum commersonii]|uniref:DUF4283 domain-containing protein n=1 Tax=Solanum commersonii TaxID=4109 RepID=A0A9J6B720_SOLCO|nr:hypothetical protein H5410_004197 [Solanum commersonii]
MEDYMYLLSKAAFYVKAKENYWQMGTLKWDSWFEHDVEKTIGVAWISFPDLPPNFFVKEVIFSIASVVGKPLTVDMATKNQTRPSCARVKIEVDLTAKLPERVKINEEDDITGHIEYKWIKVQYDYIPKYSEECCLQGNDDYGCWTIHPELEEKEESEVDGDEDQALEESTKEWVNKPVKSGMKDENKKDICKEACNLIHSPKEITLEKQEKETRDGGNGVTQEDKRDIAVYSTDNEEILPLAIQNENGGSI